MRYILMISIFFINWQIWGQHFSAQILDENNAAIADAYVYNLQNSAHAHSDVNGYFRMMPTEVGDTLRIGRLGFEVHKHVVKAKDIATIDTIILKELPLSLNEIVISPKLNALKRIAAVDLKLTPVASSQELLQHVPGLFIGQHAGGGKAEQIFLRGFDIDHGTDIGIDVDGMPVNMVSHAHGQGYADLHFVIPETIADIDFNKGAYDVSKGNFTTAGAVGFKTKDYLDSSTLGINLGKFNTKRLYGLFNLMKNNNGQNAYLASEFLSSDGYFQSSQNFSRFNVFGKYNAWLSDKAKLTLSASHFTSTWDASGQIPQRAVDDGTISRFGAIDDTEGGQTARTNLNMSYYNNIDDKTSLKTNIFYSQYDFELYSNFTFFLEDSINGDQIRQKEERELLGLHTKLKKQLRPNVSLTSGLGFRYDMISDNELSRTRNRNTTLSNTQLGDVEELNYFGYTGLELKFGKLILLPGLRWDHFKFSYENKLATAFDKRSKEESVYSPKFNVLFSPNESAQIFLKSGMGFHTNDSRVITDRSVDHTIPQSFGADIGTILKPTKRLILNTALWYLFLEQEFVYVGDAGIVEPSGRTRRLGIDVGARYQINDHLFFDGDLNYAYARSIDADKGNDRIALAPDLTFTTGLSLNDYKGFSGGFRTRYIKDRPANEDNSIIAKGYLVTDLNVSYQKNNFQMGLVLNNLFDVKWNETQFATESRLANEPNSVEEIHFTPGTPFNASLQFRYNL
ncbi:TonB-dependent receptor [Sungkyunkwania multivorans]|uniref:TonB-dependent receptor n=1 Tax=Sungkyunkwania multivorans TaxID=1173618 RepID=A0ABW3CUN3_9FLAO